MKAKWIILSGVALVVIGLSLWIALRLHDWQTWLGFTKQDYFVTGQNYAFYSGIGPMLLTALGFSTIIGGLWHAHNCHAEGCWNVGKHRVKGSPYCGSHYEDAQSQRDEMDLLTDILAELRTLNAQRSGAS